MDFVLLSHMCPRMDEKAHDRLDLSKALSTQVGMICEDFGASAILVGHLGPEEMRVMLLEVRQRLGEAEIIAAAASALLEARAVWRPLLPLGIGSLDSENGRSFSLDSNLLYWWLWP